MSVKLNPAVWISCVVAVGLLCIFYSMASYRLADYQHEKLLRSQVKNKDEVERILFLDSKTLIDIKESLWGNNYKIAEGESCWQYRILGRAPIDIVYDAKGQVIHIFASYE